MATTKISAMTAASTIDAVNDYVPIIHSGANFKINRNTLLGLSSQPLGLTDTQSPTNKTFDNTSSYTTKAGNFTLQDGSDTTKQMNFSLSGITTGNTRTLTVPDASGTLVTTAATQTLTNKTLTAPTISGGTIDNSTITVDSISGHSVATTVTVANMQINNGAINSANAVTSTSITAGAVQPQALQSGTGTGWAWQTWSPTWTNFTPGNATITASYLQTGKTVNFSVYVSMGTTSSMGNGPTFSLPVTGVYPTFYQPLGGAYMALNGAAAVIIGSCDMVSTTAAGVVAQQIVVTGNATYYPSFATVSSTVPFTWGTSSILVILGAYQAA